jgi:hypothetical protein
MKRNLERSSVTPDGEVHIVTRRDRCEPSSAIWRDNRDPIYLRNDVALLEDSVTRTSIGDAIDDRLRAKYEVPRHTFGAECEGTVAGKIFDTEIARNRVPRRPSRGCDLRITRPRNERTDDDQCND